MPHGVDAERRPLVRNRGADDEPDRRVLEDFARAARPRGRWKTPGERLGQIGLRREERDELSAALNDRVDLAVDVAVIEANGRKSDPGAGCPRGARRGAETRL